MLAVSDMADETLLGVSGIGRAASERRGSGGVVHPYRETVTIKARPAEVILYDRDMIEHDRRPWSPRVRLGFSRPCHGGPVVLVDSSGAELYRMPVEGYGHGRSAFDSFDYIIVDLTIGASSST